MKRIKLTQGQFAIVDDKHYEWLLQWKWYANWSNGIQSFYAMRNSKSVNGKKTIILMHREILGLKKGDKRHSDHKNHNTLDNREMNLKIVNHQQNQFNRRNVKGYYWHKKTKKYLARIVVNYKIIHLGYFNKSEEAHNAYLEAKKKYHR